MATKKPQKQYAYVLTTSTYRGYDQNHYANATITVNEVQTYNNEPWLTEVFSMTFYTHQITDKDVERQTISAIQPVCYYEQQERWPYRYWYNDKIIVQDSFGWIVRNLETAPMLVNKLIKERSKVENDWDKAYDRLDTVIKCLDRVGILQAQVDRKTGKTVILPKGVFSRTDLDGLDLPSDDECHEPVYPWTVVEVTETVTETL